MVMEASANLQPLVDFLSSVEIFSAFTRDDLEQLAEHTESRFFQFGETVCNAGEPAEGLFVIKSGSVRIFTEERGKEVSMGMRKARDVFAEIASRHLGAPDLKSVFPGYSLNQSKLKALLS